MVQLARLVRWWFGMQALVVAMVFVFITGSLAWRLIKGPTAAHHPVQAQTPHALPMLPYGLPPTKLVILTIVLCLMGSILASAIAWLALRRGWRSARFWALSASVLNLAYFGLGTAFGVAGLIVFWRKDIVEAMAAGGPDKPPERIPGDGTSKYLDNLAQGLALAFFLAASYGWNKWAEHLGLVRHYGILRWVEFFGALYVAVLFHELGHFLASLIAEMSIRGFAVGPLAGQIRGGRWRFAVNPGGFLGGGAVSLVPLHLRDLRGRYVYISMAGPLFSLITGMLALILALAAPGSPWEGAWRFLALTGTICLTDFVINLMPLRPDGAYSDGAQILQMVKGGRWADAHMAFSMAGSSLVTSLRPAQFDLPLLERVADFYQSGPQGAQVRLLIAIHHVESGRPTAATEAWREAARLHPEPSADVSAEYTFLEAAVAQDIESARAWWKRVEAKGDSKRELDYWRGRTAMLWVEQDFDGARDALGKADAFARSLPAVGAYDYDRWCLDMLRGRLGNGQVVTNDLAAEPVLSY